MRQLVILMLAIIPEIGMTQIVVNGVNLNEKKDVGYLELYLPEVNGLPTREVRVFYSEDKEANQNGTLRDENGNKLIFISTVSALNYFYKNGWEMAWHYPGAVENGTPFRFLLKRRGG